MKDGERGSVLEELMKKLVGLGMGLTFEFGFDCLSVTGSKATVD